MPECLMEFCKVTLTFESVDEILWCDHSNETSLPVLTHGAICFSKFYKMKFENRVEICLWLHLAVKGLKRQMRPPYVVHLPTETVADSSNATERAFFSIVLELTTCYWQCWTVFTRFCLKDLLYWSMYAPSRSQPAFLWLTATYSYLTHGGKMSKNTLAKNLIFGLLKICKERKTLSQKGLIPFTRTKLSPKDWIRFWNT